MDLHSFELLDTDPDPGGQKGPTKKEKYKEISCSLLRAEGFSCSLGVLYTVQRRTDK